MYSCPCKVRTTPVPTFGLSFFLGFFTGLFLTSSWQPGRVGCPGFRCLTVFLPLVHASRAHVLFLRLATRRFGWCVPPLKDLVAWFSGLGLQFQIRSFCSTVESHCYSQLRTCQTGFW